MITRTLKQLRDGSASRADVTSHSAGRYSDAVVDGFVNAAIRRLHLRMSEAGAIGTLRTELATTSSTTDANGWPANEILVLPALTEVIGVSIEEDGHYRPMTTFDELERDDFDSAWRSTGRPHQYRLAQDSTGAQVLRLLPPSDGAYTVRIVYTLAPTTLSADSDSFSFFPPGDEWVECDAALAILESLEGVGEVEHYRALERRARSLWMELERHLKRVNPSRPGRVQNTRRIRANGRLRNVYGRGV